MPHVQLGSDPGSHSARMVPARSPPLAANVFPCSVKTQVLSAGLAEFGKEIGPVPLKVVDALFSNAKDNELNIVAALQQLSDAGDALLITVQDATQHVRVWVDTRSSSD